ncbi:neutral zinc metallopeptidase [Nocardiopsis sp. HNM0947]|uniref:Neutral zinc metallopeptidase n=1 Tax=Nocardiopsis coralli TaxID=2772213 RepID=A0ABR9P4U8_9ACTN|nr:neutral zinc metallopeptidase [Nocardiopsis coralli]MBE2998745.1 neutral zinc metallopeptidase [Nocardiopsis coralli]
MHAGFGESSRAEAVRRARRSDRRVFALVTALLVALLALTLLSWTTVAEEGSGGASQEMEDPADVGPPADETNVPGSGAVSERLGTQDTPTGRTALVANPLYESGRLSPLPCPVPELESQDPESMEEFLHTIADCLDQTWEAQFAKAGLEYEAPERVFWEEPGVSPCRPYPSPAGAFYCRASESIYIGLTDVVEKWNGASQSVIYASLLAHEYAHHVQGESGLLEYYHEQRQLETEEADRNSWTRRSELQANCMAGAFLGSVRVSYPLTDGDLDTLLTDAAATADRPEETAEERTHGSIDNSVSWTEQGWEEQDPGVCNTWEASEDEVY